MSPSKKWPEYASEDADIAWQLAEIIEAKLKEQGLWDLYWNLERPLIPVLAQMEWHGIKVDADGSSVDRAHAASERLEVLVREIHRLAGQRVQYRLPQAARRDPVRRARSSPSSSGPRPAPAPTRKSSKSSRSSTSSRTSSWSTAISRS